MREGLTPAPYRSSPIFDENSLPTALQREHRTKQGVWGILRALEGRLKLTYSDTGEEQMLAPGAPGLVLPDQPHFVEVQGPVRMRVDFYDQCPDLLRPGCGLEG